MHLPQEPNPEEVKRKAIQRKAQLEQYLKVGLGWVPQGREGRTGSGLVQDWFRTGSGLVQHLEAGREGLAQHLEAGQQPTRGRGRVLRHGGPWGGMC